MNLLMVDIVNSYKVDVYRIYMGVGKAAGDGLTVKSVTLPV